MVRSVMEGRARRVTLLVLVACAMAVALALLAQSAGAYAVYRHATAQSCASCHPGGETGVPLTDANCTSCHTGGFVSRQTGATTTRTCWTCHEPGEDMAPVQGAGCGAAAAGCHAGGPHFGSNTLACTSCHGVVQSGTDPGTSAHHNSTAYAAPTCTASGCHGAVPHEEFVPAVACTTCHGGYDATHPDPALVVPPTATLTATPAIVKYGLTTILAESLKSGTTGIVGKTVTLQQKPAGSADFAAVAETTTVADGAFVFAAQSPTMLTTYRIVAQGAVVNTTVVKPAVKTVDVKVKPVLTIALSKTKILLGARVTIKGTLMPGRAGGVVKLTIQRKVGTAWKTQVTKNVALTAGSGYTAYSYKYKPLKKGSYRVMASVGATAELIATKTAYKSWVVK